MAIPPRAGVNSDRVRLLLRVRNKVVTADSERAFSDG
jgi:hypothetical protein